MSTVTTTTAQSTASTGLAVPAATPAPAFAVRVRLGAGQADVSFDAVDPARDAALVQGWLAHPRSAFCTKTSRWPWSIA